MTHHMDEFSKSLAEEPVPRRESLRRWEPPWPVRPQPAGAGDRLGPAAGPVQGLLQLSQQAAAGRLPRGLPGVQAATPCGTCGGYVCWAVAGLLRQLLR